MKSKINLFEWLMIFIVLSILGWITYNQFELAKAKSRDVDRRSTLNQLGQIIRLYYADYGKLPLEEEINNIWGKEWRDGNYVYLKMLPKENYLEKEYCYQVADDGKSFRFYAELENKTDEDYKKDNWECNGVKYSYRDVMEAVVVK